MHEIPQNVFVTFLTCEDFFHFINTLKCKQRYARKAHLTLLRFAKKRRSGPIFITACIDVTFVFMKAVRNSIKSWKSIQLFLIPLHTRKVKIWWAGLGEFKTGLLNLSISGLIKIEFSFKMVPKSPIWWMVHFFALSLD